MRSQKDYEDFYKQLRAGGRGNGNQGLKIK